MVKLKGRDFISLHDFTTEELEEIIYVAEKLKAEHLIGEDKSLLKGKTLGMVFQKPSTRTRISFEVAMLQLGGHAIYLSANDLQLKRGETIGDTASVLSRYVDGIMARVYSHQDILDLAKYASVPVINGLSDYNHPCQAVGDYLTIKEKMGRLKGLKLAYVGDGNNVAHSLMFGAAKFGVNIVVATPKGYEPDKEVFNLASSDAKRTGASILVINDPIVAVQDADIVYADVWASMGQEAEHDEKVKVLKPFSITTELLKHAKNNTIVMHCLPAHRGEEITDEVMDGPNSAIMDQAENRLHAQKAILALLLG